MNWLKPLCVWSWHTLYKHDTSTFKRLQPLCQLGAGECNLHQHLPRGFSLYVRIYGDMRPGSPYPGATLRLHNLGVLFPGLGGADKRDPEARADFCPWTTDSVSTVGTIVVLFACCDNTLLVCNFLCIRTPLLWSPILMVELQTRDSTHEFFQNFSSSFLGCAIIFQKATFSRRVELDYWCNALRTLLMFGIVVTWWQSGKTFCPRIFPGC